MSDAPIKLLASDGERVVALGADLEAVIAARGRELLAIEARYTALRAQLAALVATWRECVHHAGSSDEGDHWSLCADAVESLLRETPEAEPRR